VRSLLEAVLGGLSLLGAVLAVLPGRDAPGELESVSEREAPARAARHTTSYTLEARLDAELHRVTGRGRIAFVNTAREPVSSLFVHLYLNAFEDARTLFLRSPLRTSRSGRAPVRYGHIDVVRLTSPRFAGRDLWASAARHSPGDPEDRTDIEVPLPEPVAPGERLDLDVEFVAELPSIVERTGFHDRFHFVAQWFPKLARLEPDGTWAHFAFHPYAEFYADFGRYDVTIDVPDGFVVGATGARVEANRSGGRLRVRHVAEPVHDFAWTAWDGFEQHETHIGKTRVTFLYPPAHRLNRDLSERVLRFALPHLSRRFGPYPYPTLTVVEPPPGAEPAGGMEYPTLITTGAPWYAPFVGARLVEAVTTHELAHQWFYGLVASNEARFPFLDEGLTTFAEITTLEGAYGSASFGRLLGLELSGHSVARAVGAEFAADQAIAAAAAEFESFEALGALVYYRMASLLTTLGRVFGPERLERALGEYARENRFEHPRPEALVDVIRAHLGERAAIALERALFERGRVNYAVRDLSSRPVSSSALPASARGQGAPAGSQRYEGRVTVVRQGSLELPVDVLLLAEDGTRHRVAWDGTGHSRSFPYVGSAPLTHAIIDPTHRVLIDDDLLDNYATVSPNRLPRVHERLAYWAALMLGGLAP